MRKTLGSDERAPERDKKVDGHTSDLGHARSRVHSLTDRLSDHCTDDDHTAFCHITDVSALLLRISVRQCTAHADQLDTESGYACYYPGVAA